MTRQELVDSPHIIFQDDTQRSDLLDPTITQNCLIELLSEIVGAGYHLELTAVKSDHHDDSALGLHSHFNGYCVDCWPLSDATPGNYVDAGTLTFQGFLASCASLPNLYQIGLGGSAFTPTNMKAAGSTAFQDDGADHVHIGSQE